MPIDIPLVAWTTGIACFFSMASALGVVWITKRSDERRHRREVAFNLALESHKIQLEHARNRAAQSPPGTTISVESIDMAIIHAAALCNLLEDSPDRGGIAKRLREAHDIMDAARAEAERYHDQLKEVKAQKHKL